MNEVVLSPRQLGIAYNEEEPRVPVNDPYGNTSVGGCSTAPVSLAGSRLNLREYSQTGPPTDEPRAGQCGWLCLRPHCLQHARTSRWLLFWLCWAAAVQGMVVNGFVNVCITTIEKRYDLRSKDTGIVAGAYDMASVLCSVPVAYFGSRHGSSKARYLGVGMVIMGIGSFVFALPHFVTPPYDANVRDSVGLNRSVITCSHDALIRESCASSRDGWLAEFRHVFVLGQVLHGVGATPLYTLGVTYLDESVPVRMSSMYLGVFYAMAVVGPAFGYVMGGQFLKIYIDSPQEDPGAFGLDTSSDRWLGGWWMGFVLSGFAAILVAWPLLAFPAVLPGTKEERLEIPKSSDKRASVSSASIGINGFNNLKDFPTATRSLMSNITFVALSIAGATEGILLSGFATFIPKFIESQFSVAASFSALAVGFIAVPAGGGGTLLGGWFIKKYELSCSSILKVLFIGSIFCLLSCFSLLIYCPNQQFAGVDVDYEDTFGLNGSMSTLLPSLRAPCNSRCGCDGVSYNPVCGSNNVIYYSPCHAGCSQRHEYGPNEVFSNCSCIPQAVHVDQLEHFQLPEGVPSSLLTKGVVLRDKCPTTCKLGPYFIFLCFLMMLFTFTISLPALSGTLRCVAAEQRSLALGVQWIIVRLLGTIPGPILFGSVIDYTCRLWQKSCDVQGSCLSYNNLHMSRYMLGISFLAKSFSTVLFLIAWWFYRPVKEGTCTPLGSPCPSAITLSSPVRIREDTSAHLAYDNPAVDIT